MTKMFLLAKGYIRSFFSDTAGLFWNMIFPLILAALLSFTVGGIADRNPVETLTVGYHADSLEVQVLENIPELELIHYETEPDNHLRTIQQDELTAFVTADGTLEVSELGMAQEVLQQMVSTAKQAMSMGPDARHLDFGTERVSIAEQDMEVQTLPFLSILSLFSFYSYFGGTTAALLMQANLTNFAARLQVSPVKKHEQIIALAIPGMLLNLFNNIVLIGFMHFVLGEQVITNFWATLPVLTLANFVGMGFGLIVGTSNKMPETAKIMFGVVVLMALAVMTGLMYPAMILVVRRKFPLLDTLNPIAVIQKSLVAVNQPGHMVTGTPQLGYLAILAVVFMGISALILSRRSFKSLGV